MSERDVRIAAHKKMVRDRLSAMELAHARLETSYTILLIRAKQDATGWPVFDEAVLELDEGLVKVGRALTALRKYAGDKQ